MSVFNESIRSNSWAEIPRRYSERFTTLSGWREIGTGVYAMGSNIRIFPVQHQFDPKGFRDTRIQAPRPRTAESKNSDQELRPRTAASSESAEIERDAWETSGTMRDEGGRMIGKAIGSVRHVSPEVSRRARRIEREKKSTRDVYHVFTPRAKWAVVILVAVAGLFTDLSWSAYVPALDAISRDLNITPATVSLTLTSYLLIQGIAPLLWTPLSNNKGRRPTYIYTFIIYIFSNFALSISPNLATLLIFRSFQAFGSTSLLAIGFSVIHDIAASNERGPILAFQQWMGGGGIVVGPILGGLLSNFLGFRAIFIFLLVLSIVVFIIIALYMPETLRRVAGNGSVHLTGIHQPLASKFKSVKEEDGGGERDVAHAPEKLELKDFISPLKLLKEKDILLSIGFSGIVFAIWIMIVASTTGLFKRTFRLNEVLLGLVFLPNALGTTLGTLLAQRVLTHDLLKAESTYRTAHDHPPFYPIHSIDIPLDFPLEQTRLRRLLLPTLLFILTTSAYGFSLSEPRLTTRSGWILVPLLLQFIISLSANGILTIHSTLIEDLCQEKKENGMVVEGIVRSWLAAAGVAGVEQMVRRLGVGASFLGLGLLGLGVVPFGVGLYCWGMEFRKGRVERVEREGGMSGIGRERTVRVEREV
ncbi:MFS general substrate transporter [Zopfia rhizophila CBS 207.26]|uniref:MFS general substrate transporter n=1 Tax=Zopfia rhizophila CBS 207.26 TaxID=1314779 RepID=A0A6A6DDS1_9PEZI|nr:MFS general substrate transporter [Zopfia rhizophila CBS 207.26]